MHSKNEEKEAGCFNCQYYLEHYIKIVETYFLTAWGTCTKHQQLLPPSSFFCVDWSKKENLC